MRRGLRSGFTVLALVALCAPPAEARPRYCDAPSEFCGLTLSSLCVERLGAGALAPSDDAAAADASEVGADCAAQLKEFRGCLQKVASECPQPKPETEEEGGPRIPLDQVKARDILAKLSVESRAQSLLYRISFEPINETIWNSFAGARLSYAFDDQSTFTPFTLGARIETAAPPRQIALRIATLEGRTVATFRYPLDAAAERDALVQKALARPWASCASWMAQSISRCTISLSPALAAAGRRVWFGADPAALEFAAELAAPENSRGVVASRTSPFALDVVAPIRVDSLFAAFELEGGRRSEVLDLRRPLMSARAARAFELESAQDGAPLVIAEVAGADETPRWHFLVLANADALDARWSIPGVNLGAFTRRGELFITPRHLSLRDVGADDAAPPVDTPLEISLRREDGRETVYRYRAPLRDLTLKARLAIVQESDLRDFIACKRNTHARWGEPRDHFTVVCEFSKRFRPGDVFEEIYWGVNSEDLADLDDYADPYREAWTRRMAEIGEDGPRKPTRPGFSLSGGAAPAARYGGWRDGSFGPTRENAFLAFAEPVRTVFLKVRYRGGGDSEVIPFPVR